MMVLESIAEVHPSIKSADIYPRMRSVTDEDLTAIAGHILLQPKILFNRWKISIRKMGWWPFDKINYLLNY
jgi:hypothetical protein